MLNQPTSSPMMNRMLGFLSCACAVSAAASNAAHAMTAVVDTYSHLQRFVFIIPFLLVTFSFSRSLTCQAAIKLWLLSRDALWPLELVHNLAQVIAGRILHGREIL